MSNYANAKTPAALRGGEDGANWLYIQWHHGTDSRNDALPDGGWEIERKKYQGFNLPLKTGAVLHGNGTVDCWVAQSLTLAIIDSRLTWYMDDPNQRDRSFAPALPAYKPGAWSRLRVLCWVAEIDRLAVLTMRGAASQDFIAGVNAYKAGPLALARLENPDLPVAAFWLTVIPGERTKRGTSGSASFVTPPVFILPQTEDQREVSGWLEANYVGQEMLDRFAQAEPLIRQFRQAQPVASQPAENAEAPVPETEQPPAQSAPTGARCASGHIYDAAKWGDACPTCATIEDARRAEERAKALHEQRKAGVGQSDDFDKLRPASEDPAVQAALAAADRKAEQRQPIMPEPPSPTTGQDASQPSRSTTNGVKTPPAPPSGPGGHVDGAGQPQQPAQSKAPRPWPADLVIRRLHSSVEVHAKNGAGIEQTDGKFGALIAVLNTRFGRLDYEQFLKTVCAVSSAKELSPAQRLALVNWSGIHKTGEERNAPWAISQEATVEFERIVGYEDIPF